jgi:hypothetical protein
MPNVCLESLFRETGWTLRQMAQAVNRLGTECGLPLKYREPSVHQWLSGHLPKENVRSLIVEALSRRLGRPVSHREAGFPPHHVSPNTFPSTVEGLIDLGRDDMDSSRRGFLEASLFSVASTIPDWPDVVGRMEAAQSGRLQRVGMPEVNTVVSMTERLSRLDDEFGGAYARPMAAAFLVNTVGPYLRTDGPDEVRKSMLSAAADLCYLAGYMAVDEGWHGLAQRYYVKALELAGAAEDHLTYCTTLRGMSVQAAELGHGARAGQLADAGAAASRDSGPRKRAFFAAQQAHAAALSGDRRGALAYLRATEKAMDQADSRAGTFGSFDPAAFQYCSSQVRYELGDRAGAVEAMQRSVRLHEQGDYRRIRDDRLTSLLSMLGTHRRNPQAREVLERARAVVPSARTRTT